MAFSDQDAEELERKLEVLRASVAEIVRLAQDTEAPSEVLAGSVIEAFSDMEAQPAVLFFKALAEIDSSGLFPSALEELPEKIKSDYVALTLSQNPKEY